MTNLVYKEGDWAVGGELGGSFLGMDMRPEGAGGPL